VLVVDALIGPFVYRRLLTGGDLDDRFVERLLGPRPALGVTARTASAGPSWGRMQA